MVTEHWKGFRFTKTFHRDGIHNGWECTCYLPEHQTDHNGEKIVCKRTRNFRKHANEDIILRKLRWWALQGVLAGQTGQAMTRHGHVHEVPDRPAGELPSLEEIDAAMP